MFICLGYKLLSVLSCGYFYWHVFEVNLYDYQVNLGWLLWYSKELFNCPQPPFKHFLCAYIKVLTLTNMLFQVQVLFRSVVLIFFTTRGLTSCNYDMEFAGFVFIFLSFVCILFEFSVNCASHLSCGVSDALFALREAKNDLQVTFHMRKSLDTGVRFIHLQILLICFISWSITVTVYYCFVLHFLNFLALTP